MIQRRVKRTSPTNALSAAIERQVAAVESEHRQTLVDWQCKSLEERGQGISACCQSAAAIMEARRKMGLAPPTRLPWPTEIWDMLRRHAADVRN